MNDFVLQAHMQRDHDRPGDEQDRQRQACVESGDRQPYSYNQKKKCNCRPFSGLKVLKNIHRPDRFPLC